jgi:nucleotide-binding universal stress UspA family protein
LYRDQAKIDAAKLSEIAQGKLHNVNYEIITEIGDPVVAILKTACTIAADIVVLATHGRKGLARLFSRQYRRSRTARCGLSRAGGPSAGH